MCAKQTQQNYGQNRKQSKRKAAECFKVKNNNVVFDSFEEAGGAQPRGKALICCYYIKYNMSVYAKGSCRNKKKKLKLLCI